MTAGFIRLCLSSKWDELLCVPTIFEVRYLELMKAVFLNKTVGQKNVTRDTSDKLKLEKWEKITP